jgi:heat shock protein HslJ
MEHTMKIRRLLLAVLTTGLIGSSLSSCDSAPATASPNPVESNSPDSLLGQWFLFGVDSTTVLDRSIPLTFGDTDHIHGSDGCNSINGAYFASSTTLRISALTSTAMNCIDSRYPNLSSQVGLALQSLRTWKVVAGELDLSDSTGTIRLRYKRTPSSSIDPGWFRAQPCTLSVDSSATGLVIEQVGTDTSGLSLLPLQITSAVSTDSGAWLDVVLPHPGVQVRIFALDSMRMASPTSTKELPQDLYVAGVEPSCTTSSIQVLTPSRIFVPWHLVQMYVRFFGAAGGEFTLLPPGTLLD